MIMERVRPNSLTLLTIPNVSWSAPRPPTPRRATFPFDKSPTSAPPIPALSYWHADTPSTSTSTAILPSLRKAPSHLRLNTDLDMHNTLFKLASPVLPASPLSIWDKALSPLTSGTFLFSRSPTPLSRRPSIFRSHVGPASPIALALTLTAASPLTPRFLHPRAVPPPPTKPHTTESSPANANSHQPRKESTTSLALLREKYRVEFYHLLATKQYMSEEAERAAEVAAAQKTLRRSKWTQLVPGLRLRKLFTWSHQGKSGGGEHEAGRGVGSVEVEAMETMVG